MNDWKITTSALEEIIKVASRDLPITDRCALYAGTAALLGDVERHFENRVGGYMSEKITQVRWHIGANLGFDITNGHDEQHHATSALGALQTLQRLLKDEFRDHS